MDYRTPIFVLPFVNTFQHAQQLVPMVEPHHLFQCISDTRREGCLHPLSSNEKRLVDYSRQFIEIVRPRK